VGDLDSAAVDAGLSAANAQMNAAADDEAKALAQISVDVHEAMKDALTLV
jgi:hypothetical protein